MIAPWDGLNVNNLHSCISPSNVKCLFYVGNSLQTSTKNSLLQSCNLLHEASLVWMITPAVQHHRDRDGHCKIQLSGTDVEYGNKINID